MSNCYTCCARLGPLECILNASATSGSQNSFLCAVRRLHQRAAVDEAKTVLLDSGFDCAGLCISRPPGEWPPPVLGQAGCLLVMSAQRPTGHRPLCLLDSITWMSPHYRCGSCLLEGYTPLKSVYVHHTPLEGGAYLWWFRLFWSEPDTYLSAFHADHLPKFFFTPSATASNTTIQCAHFLKALGSKLSSLGQARWASSLPYRLVQSCAQRLLIQC